MKILLLVALILLMIASYMFAQYFWYDFKPSFSYIYTYFFGALFIMLVPFSLFVSIGVYAYALYDSQKSTFFEKYIAKAVLVIFVIISVVYLGNYFGLDMGFETRLEKNISELSHSQK